MPPLFLPCTGRTTRFYFHRVVSRMSAVPDAPDQPAGGGAAAPPQATSFPNGIIDVFDEDGNFAHFVWNGTVPWGKAVKEIGVWEWSSEPVTVTPPESLRDQERRLSTCAQISS